MYYNLAKTAELLGLNTGDVNRLREQGKLRAFKDGADWKFRKEEVEQYLTKMIKERSAQNSDDGLLASEDDDDKTAFAVDSSAFDAMFDQAGDDLQVSANNDDLVVNDDNGNNDDLQLAPADDDDFKLVDDDDELKLAPEEAPEDALVKEGDSPLTSEDSALAEDLAAVDLTSASGSGSGDGLTLGSDSGLSLLDDVGGSNIDLAGDGDDLILCGSSGSGSGDGMSLGSDSGLSLMDDAEGGFELDAAVSEQGGLDLAPQKDDEDDSVFALAGENDASGPQILNLDQNADSEAPTELAAEESVFELSSQTTDAPQSSESMSSSVFMTEDAPSETANPFLTDDSSEGESDIFALAGEPDAPATSGVDDSASNSIDVLDDASTETVENPFMSDESTDSPFGDSTSDMAFTPSSDSSPFGGDSFGGDAGGDFGSSSDFGDAGGFSDSSDFGGATFSENETAPAASGVSSMQFTGKDLIFLVPCLIFLLLATIGALELCRTIWSYQEGTFDIGGPLLEAIAKMVKLM